MGPESSRRRSRGSRPAATLGTRQPSTRSWGRNVAGGFAPGGVLLLIAVLAAFGVADAGYLTYQWYEAADSTWCDLDSYWSCSAVRESPWASVAGIPTAVVGVAGFGILLAVDEALRAVVGALVARPAHRQPRQFRALGAAVGA